MTEARISFDDGAAYERYMGEWSRLVGEKFLDWLALPAALRWLDVGCGNGAFTGLLLQRCAPSLVVGIDPSEAQLEFARSRFVPTAAQFQQGDAMNLPFDADEFDAAVMPLVIFFVREPGLGVSEMTRVVAPGGTVTAYAWDMPGGGFPYAIVNSAARSLGIDVPSAPSPEASRLDVMHELWSHAGLEQIESRSITVERSFDGFDEYWDIILGGPSMGRKIAGLGAADRSRLRDMLREALPAPDREGRITTRACANAIRGELPLAARRSAH